MRVMVLTGGLVAATVLAFGACAEGGAQGETGKEVTKEQYDTWMTELSNWGRWGDDDQMGCPNLITPAKRQQAASLVRDGVAVSCARPIVTDLTPDISHQVQRYMVDSGEGRDTDPE